MNAVGVPYQLPKDKQAALQKAKKIEWAAIFFLLTIIGVLAIVMGASQTMKAMWVEDTLSLIPSCSFLIGARLRKKTRAKSSRTGIGGRS